MNFNNSSIVSKGDIPSPFYNNSINYEEHPFRATNNNFRATNRGFSAHKGKQTGQLNYVNQKLNKDPDIWEAPPPL